VKSKYIVGGAVILVSRSTISTFRVFEMFPDAEAARIYLKSHYPNFYSPVEFLQAGIISVLFFVLI